MTKNILNFSRDRKLHNKPATPETRDNVIWFDTRRTERRIRRTPHGVFFMTNAFCTPGDAA